MAGISGDCVVAVFCFCAVYFPKTYNVEAE